MDEENRISRVPVRSPRYMPCSHQTPAGPERQAIQRSRCCLPLLARRRLPQLVNFGAQSHGLHRRCLRFAVTVTRPPRKTRFRLVTTLGRTGFDPQDLFRKFPSDSSHVIPSPFPELCSAHAGYDIVPHRPSGNTQPPAQCHTGHSTGKPLCSACSGSEEGRRCTANVVRAFQSTTRRPR